MVSNKESNMPPDEQITDEQIEALVTKMLCKMTEINSMMRNGQYIVAYEKLGGIQKNLTQLGSALQKRRLPVINSTE